MWKKKGLVRATIGFESAKEIIGAFQVLMNSPQFATVRYKVCFVWELQRNRNVRLLNYYRDSVLGLIKREHWIVF